MRYAVFAVLAVFLSGGTNTAFSWGHQGHETVGYIAALLIKGTNAEKQVRKLLDSDETLASAAEWADCAKGYTYCQADPTPAMQDFAGRNKNHHNYHYTDVPYQLSAYKKGIVGTTRDDIVNIMEDAILVLKGQPPSNPAHDITKREALYILAHMTGDIHQPLHVGAGYISEDQEFFVPKNEADAKASFTEGGNFLCDKSKGVHSKWDSDYVVKAMKVAQSTTSDEFAIALLAKAKKFKANTGDAKGWPTKWATETLHLASLEIDPITIVQKRGAGPGKSPCRATDAKFKGSVWDVELPDQYAADGASTASDQIAKAGARLAKLLRAIWP
jgi:hypothetical protein